VKPNWTEPKIHQAGADRLEPRARARVQFVGQLRARPHERVGLVANDERARCASPRPLG